MNNKDLIKKLKKARKLIETGEHWTQEESFKDKNDKPLYAEDIKNAVKFCAIGAMLKSKMYDNCQYVVRDSCLELFGSKFIHEINDKIGLDAVLSCFDYTIDKLEAK